LIDFPTLQTYWTGNFLEANALIVLNLFGALLLGMAVGYERSYHGRAAGMRTYGLVCMASTALTVFVGFAKYWYGGTLVNIVTDPTRVVQGVVTGIGFLCAGVIMKDGLSISGLTTAASIWAVSAIGVLLGVGFYGAALALALLCILAMTVPTRLEAMLPARVALGISLTFSKDFVPKEEVLVRAAAARGYVLLLDSLAISYDHEQPVWKFSAVARDKANRVTPAVLAEELARFEGVVQFSIVPSRM
jgi:putative Mg2+ transporter-C (MgtC) family protein